MRGWRKGPLDIAAALARAVAGMALAIPAATPDAVTPSATDPERVSSYRTVSMRIRLLLAAAAATLTLAACSASPTAPGGKTPGARSNDGDEACRSGYHLATRSDGTTDCVPD
jgi:hypothetical protein